jgi:hypothetical protein
VGATGGAASDALDVAHVGPAERGASSDPANLGQFPDGGASGWDVTRGPASVGGTSAGSGAAGADPLRGGEISAMHLSSLDWDLPDDLDMPSSFDRALSGGSRGAKPAADDSLPSMSSIFGNGDARRGQSPAGSVDVAPVADGPNPLAASDSPLDLELELADLSVEANTAPTEAVASAPTGPSPAVVEAPPATATASGMFAVVGAGVTGGSTSVPVRGGRASMDTPLVPPRHLQKTPIIASPVVAARVPTPGPQPTPVLVAPAPPAAPQVAPAPRWGAARLVGVFVAGVAFTVVVLKLTGMI